MSRGIGCFLVKTEANDHRHENCAETETSYLLSLTKFSRITRNSIKWFSHKENKPLPTFLSTSFTTQGKKYKKSCFFSLVLWRKSYQVIPWLHGWLFVLQNFAKRNFLRNATSYYKHPLLFVDGENYHVRVMKVYLCVNSNCESAIY